jgi:hypothetical protein
MAVFVVIVVIGLFYFVAFLIVGCFYLLWTNLVMVGVISVGFLSFWRLLWRDGCGDGP